MWSGNASTEETEHRTHELTTATAPGTGRQRLSSGTCHSGVPTMGMYNTCVCVDRTDDAML